MGACAEACLRLECETWPKPGLVSHVDAGSHGDMDAALLIRSAAVLRPFFTALAQAGEADADLPRLREIGLAAEARMMAATGGVNTHRGAIFALGLLCAAAAQGGGSRPGGLGRRVRDRWGNAILETPPPPSTHGTAALTRYGVGGARQEAASGFASAYAVGLPALRAGRVMRPGNAEAARVQCFFALLATTDDTNLLHRGGAGGLAFAQRAAQEFLAAGGVAANDWCQRATETHRQFVARRLSPGGCADLLAVCLFIDASEAA
ncbi:MAG: triphosphoribosyl-dephospho-CoA synthase MdcB [Proteobacteria bacterium]|nr:triphosphoribosyl-dephospho-CoA synthase MdcB [Pseudomonadota bacterium]